jgi:subtilisin family serine protease
MRNLFLVLIVAMLLVPVVLAIDRYPVAGQEIKERWIVPTTSLMDKLIFRLKGCTIIHDLNDATAIKCPRGVQIENAFEDEVYTIMDIDADKQINADDVWALGYTGSGVVVAVLDTGIDTDHPELADSIAGGKGFGYATFEDDNGHGTHVSGIITANGVDSKAKGVAPDAKVWMAKVCDASGSCYVSDIAAAIDYVVKGPDSIPNNGDEPAKIMSISLGGGGTSATNCDSDYLAIKVNWAVDNGVTVVAAAGNTAGRVSSPACASKAIAVGVVNKSDVRASWSGTGLALDIMAPGVSIYSSMTGGYASWSGTSMATPHVSATIALLRQVNSALTDSQIKDALYKTAKDLGTAGWDKYYGWGRVDVLAAVNSILPPTTTTTTTSTSTTITTTTSTTTTTLPPTQTMHVGNIQMTINKISSICKASAKVPILDSSNVGVASATVYGSWSGAFSKSVSGSTDSSGNVRFTTSWVKCGTFTFCVSNVVKSGWQYDSSANVETCDSIGV